MIGYFPANSLASLLLGTPNPTPFAWGVEQSNGWTDPAQYQNVAHLDQYRLNSARAMQQWNGTLAQYDPRTPAQRRADDLAAIGVIEVTRFL